MVQIHLDAFEKKIIVMGVFFALLPLMTAQVTVMCIFILRYLGIFAQYMFNVMLKFVTQALVFASEKDPPPEFLVFIVISAVFLATLVSFGCFAYLIDEIITEYEKRKMNNANYNDEQK